MWERWEGGPISSAHGCQLLRAPVSLLNWCLTEKGLLVCGGLKGSISGLCSLSQVTSDHMSPTSELSIPRLSPQN